MSLARNIRDQASNGEGMKAKVIKSLILGFMLVFRGIWLRYYGTRTFVQAYENNKLVLEKINWKIFLENIFNFVAKQ